MTSDEEMLSAGRSENTHNLEEYAPVETEEDKEKKENYGSEGMALGMCFGVAMASAMHFDIGLGLTFGMLLGLVIGSAIEKKKDE